MQNAYNMDWQKVAHIYLALKHTKHGSMHILFKSHNNSIVEYDTKEQRG